MQITDDWTNTPNVVTELRVVSTHAHGNWSNEGFGGGMAGKTGAEELCF